MLSDPTGISGWTALGTTTSGSMQTRAYTKIAAADDADRTVTVPLDAAAKYTMTVSAYSGARPGSLVHADLAETVVRAGHATPVVDAPAGSWVVSYWADKSSATTGFVLPGTVTGRHALCASGTGRVCSSLADSNGAVPTGRYGGLEATADSASAKSSATTAFTLPGEVTPREATCGANAGRVCSALADSGGGVTAGTYGGLTATADAASANATMWTVVLRQAA